MKNSLQYRSVNLFNVLLKFGYTNIPAETTAKVQTSPHNFKDTISPHDSTLENVVF